LRSRVNIIIRINRHGTLSRFLIRGSLIRMIDIIVIRVFLTLFCTLIFHGRRSHRNKEFDIMAILYRWRGGYIIFCIIVLQVFFYAEIIISTLRFLTSRNIPTIFNYQLTHRVSFPSKHSVNSFAKIVYIDYAGYNNVTRVCVYGRATDGGHLKFDFLLLQRNVVTIRTEFQPGFFRIR